MYEILQMGGTGLEMGGVREGKIWYDKIRHLRHLTWTTKRQRKIYVENTDVNEILEMDGSGMEMGVIYEKICY